MNARKLVLVVSCLAFLLPCGADASFYYSGTVKDTTGKAIAGAAVTLSGSTLSATTNASGAFTLSQATSERPVSTNASIALKLADVGKNRIVLYSVAGNPGRLTLYDVRGKLVRSLSVDPGKHGSVALDVSGCFIVRIRCGEYRETFKVMAMGGNLAGNREIFVRSGTAPAVFAKAMAGLGTQSNYLTAAKPAYYPGTAWISQDTIANISIVMADSALYASGPIYLNPSLPVSVRVKDLLSRMTLAEKASQMHNDAAAVSRLGIPAYNWWNEGLHGVARSGLATSFPAPTGIASTFDTATIFGMSSIISTEGRAKYHNYLSKGQTGLQYGGLTFWCPIVDIDRDPRWGRSLETYGEDPCLTSKIADAFIRGMQGNDPRYLKTSATAKHFAAHSGPDATRTSFNAVVTNHDLYDTYFPTFLSAIRQSGVQAVMCAYILVNGTHACSNKWLLDTMLRRTWGFTGHVVSDCGATSLVQAGCDLGCGVFTDIVNQVNAGTLSAALVDTALTRTLTTRFKLGMFDPQGMVQFSSIPISIVNCQKHVDYARTVSRKAMVLLRNRNNVLPFGAAVKTIAVVGPNANPSAAGDSLNSVMLGNYYGYPATVVSPLAGIQSRATAGGVTVKYAVGCPRSGTDTSGFVAAEGAAHTSDLIVAVLGLAAENQSPTWHVNLEGETMDRSTLSLPAIQDSLLKRLVAVGKPLVVVLLNGGSVSIDYAAANADGILEAWYPGEQGGNAIADVLFGDYNPGGKLPMTYYTGATVLPDLTNMSMQNRTYRYFSGGVLYPFGFGLSYTTFSYGNLQVSPATAQTNQPVTVSVDVTNSGMRDGDDVVEVYLTAPAGSSGAPVRSLAAFTRVTLAAGQTSTVTFVLQPTCFSLVDQNGGRAVSPGSFTLCVGSGQPIAVDGVTPPNKTGTVTLTGSVYQIN